MTTAQYADHGLRFVYPENWKLEESAEDWPREILLEAPGGALFTLHLYPETAEPAQIAAEALESLQGEYDKADWEVEPYEDPLIVVEGSPELTERSPVALGYDCTFSLLDFIVQVEIRVFRYDDMVILALFQAEDRDFDSPRQVFLAMLWSLLA